MWNLDSRGTCLETQLRSSNFLFAGVYGGKAGLERAKDRRLAVLCDSVCLLNAFVRIRYPKHH